LQIIDTDLDTIEKIEAFLRAIYGPPRSELLRGGGSESEGEQMGV
jgi:hypothetical protein